MKVKALSLIFLVVFAAVATSVVLCLSSSHTAEGNSNFTKSYNIAEGDDEIRIDPCGDEIDCPGVPT
ncbi:MAG: hypothetical protein NWE85_04145 [Candidatus Bathyarchaeota archaeon]|nr:hypothetical protein [Candidatus Bathyarchaeota archaeon]